MKGWLQSFLSCMIVFISALEPPLAPLVLPAVSVNMMPFSCMWEYSALCRPDISHLMMYSTYKEKLQIIKKM